MTAKNSKPKPKRPIATKGEAKVTQRKFASPIEAELVQVPVETVALIAASIYKHDQYPAISLLKAYELLAGAMADCQRRTPTRTLAQAQQQTSATQPH